MAAYATAAQMLERYDARTLGDLVSDTGIRVDESALLTDTVLSAALNDGAGDIELALLPGERYSTTDLTTLLASSSNTRFVLIRLNCDRAFFHLYDRRPWHEVSEAYQRRIEDGEKLLERLRRGERVFDVAAVKDAGLPSITTPERVTVEKLNLTVDYCRRGGYGYYPARRLPNQT